jgi:hypothetical protein
MSSKYFSHISSDHWHVQNKLHEAIKKIAHDMNHIIIDNDYPDTSMQQFQETITSRVDAANKEHPRCKPAELSIWNPSGVWSGKKDREEPVQVNVSGVFNMLLIPVRL